mgnify:CR=1 FL=1
MLCEHDCCRFTPGPYEPQGSDDSSSDGCAAASSSQQQTEATTTAAAAVAGVQLELSAEAVAEAPLGPADVDTDATNAVVEASVEAASSLDMLAAVAAAAAAGESSCDTVPMDLTPAATAAASVGLQDLSVPTAAAEADQGFASPAQNPDCAVSAQNPGALAVLSPGRVLNPQKKRVLLVGNPALPLKGFPTAIAALTAVSAVLPIQVRWVCQVRARLLTGTVQQREQPARLDA